MPSLPLSPNPALPGSNITVPGTGFDPHQKVQLALNGSGWTSNYFRPKSDGTFAVGMNVPKTAGTYTVSARYSSSTTVVASASLVVAAPPPPVTDWTVVTGWRNVFHDDFTDRTIAAPNFTAGGTVFTFIDPSGTKRTGGTRTADGRYNVFGTTPTSNWHDTSDHGTYAYSSVISVANGILDMAIFADAAGYGHTCVITPLPAGGSIRGGIVSGRSLVRFRADTLYGFKAVPLWWADDAMDNNMLVLGEIDGPEGNLNGAPKGYLHYAPATSSSDQFVASYPAGTTFNTWHDFVTEWRAGQSVEWFLDGASIGRVTSRIPTAAMHFNLQFETSTGSNAQIPVANTSGHVQIDRVGLWVPA